MGAERITMDLSSIYRTVLEHMNEQVYVRDLDMNLLYINPAAESLTGWPAQEAMGKKCYEVFGDAERECKKVCPVEKAISSNQCIFHHEGRLKTRGGRVLDMQVSISPLLTGAEVAGAAVVMQDITRLKKAEETHVKALAALEKEVEESRNRYSVSLDAVPDLVFEIALDGTFLYVNRFAVETLGYSRETFGRLNLADLLDEEALKEWGERYARLLETKDLGGAYRRNVRKSDGTFVPLEAHAVFLERRGRQPTILGVARLISERLEREERMEKLNRLREELLKPAGLREKLAIISEGIVSVFRADLCRIWVTKPGDLCETGCIHSQGEEGPHLCRSRHLCLHLLVSSGRYTHTDGEVHGRVPFGCYKIGKLASGEYQKFLTNEAAQEPAIHDQEWVRERGLVSFAGYRLLSAQEDVIGVLALFSRNALSPEEDALLEGLAGTASQVIQTAEVEDALRQHAELQKVLLREVNHRVKNNLSAIIGMLYMEKDHAEGQGDASYLNVLGDLVGRVEGLLTVHSLLSASGWHPLNLTELCEQVVNGSLQGVPLDKTVSVDVNRSTESISSNQAHHLTLVINELATNTVKHALAENDAVKIHMDIFREGEDVHIVFRDDGPGYPRAMMEGDLRRAGVGFDLIVGIVRETLRGRVRLDNDNGAVTTLVFKPGKDQEPMGGGTFEGK